MNTTKQNTIPAAPTGQAVRNVNDAQKQAETQAIRVRMNQREALAKAIRQRAETNPAKGAGPSPTLAQLQAANERDAARLVQMDGEEKQRLRDEIARYERGIRQMEQRRDAGNAQTRDGITRTLERMKMPVAALKTRLAALEAAAGGGGKLPGPPPKAPASPMADGPDDEPMSERDAAKLAQETADAILAMPPEQAEKLTLREILGKFPAVKRLLAHVDRARATRKGPAPAAP